MTLNMDGRDGARYTYSNTTSYRGTEAYVSVLYGYDGATHDDVSV